MFVSSRKHSRMIKLPVQKFQQFSGPTSCSVSTADEISAYTVNEPGGSALHDGLRVKCDGSHVVVKPHRVMNSKPLRLESQIKKGAQTYKKTQPT